MQTRREDPAAIFASALEWEQWLATHHRTESVLVLRIAKKASGITTVTYDEALDVALCYGWIDGQRTSFDDDYFQQRFTPRRPGSNWSKRNVGKALQLISAGRMQPAGLAEVAAAQRDGRWQSAYDAQSSMTIPDDFMAALDQNDRASVAFQTLNKSERFAIGYRLQTARTPATRARRLEALITLLESGRKP